jgi:hypothetical protein
MQMRRKHRVGVPIERHAKQLYTRRMYDKFYNELNPVDFLLRVEMLVDSLYLHIHVPKAILTN